MEKYIDVMSRILGLSETCQEALAHIKGKLNEGQLEETSVLMSVVVEGFYHLEKALADLSDLLPDHDLEQITQQVQRSLEVIVTAYEHGQPGQVQEKLQFNLQPAFLSMHHELEAILRPYTLS